MADPRIEKVLADLKKAAGPANEKLFLRKIRQNHPLYNASGGITATYAFQFGGKLDRACLVFEGGTKLFLPGHEDLYEVDQFYRSKGFDNYLNYFEAEALAEAELEMGKTGKSEAKVSVEAFHSYGSVDVSDASLTYEEDVHPDGWLVDAVFDATKKGDLISLEFDHHIIKEAADPHNFYLAEMHIVEFPLASLENLIRQSIENGKSDLATICLYKKVRKYGEIQQRIEDAYKPVMVKMVLDTSGELPILWSQNYN
jgi:hypothetical protein